MFHTATSPGTRRTVGVLITVFALLLSACGGGGGDASDNIRAPVVQAFSPFLSPMDFNTLQQNPTFTNGMLTVSTDPRYPGEIVIFFQPETEIDPRSVFVGGVPSLGLDLSALQILQFIPGTGNVELPLSNVIVEKDRIRCVPQTLPLPDGQYSIGVFRNIKSTSGKNLLFGPVFQAFTVGAADAVNPFVVTTFPVDGAIGVGAGAPPPPPPSGISEDAIADVRTNVFGPNSPDIIIRFNEGIDASTVNLNNMSVVDAGAFVPGGGAPPGVPPAPGFPKLKSVEDGATLPSNGHEIIWRPDNLSGFGGFPFGTIIQVTLTGAYDTEASYLADLAATGGTNPDNAAPVADLTGNVLLVNAVFQFQTLAPPNLPENPFPEYAIWFSGSDRVGCIDTVNQQGLADNFTGALQFPLGVPRNSWLDQQRTIPEFTDTVTTAQNVPGFEPTEISVDGRTNGATCHTWIYAMSPNSGEIVIVNSRTSIPVAIIRTTAPAGLSNQTGGGQAANVLLATNSSANTFTIFDLSNVSPGTTFLNGPVFIQATRPTGNSPHAISISLSPTGNFNRDPFQGGPAVPLIMYADLSDGVVNTTTLSSEMPIKQFNLGPNSSPNDVSLTPCFGLNPILFAAISQGGLPGEGKVAYYVAGPGCSTGTGTGGRPDSLVGDLSGFDGPSGLDEIFSVGNGAFFAVAESGSQANRVTTLGVELGANNLPARLLEIEAVGANPVAVAHRSAWLNPCIDFLDAIVLCSPNPTCWYRNTEQQLQAIDGSLAVSQDLYICAQGASQVTVVNLVNGARDFYSPIPIPSVRFVASPATQ